MRTFEINQVLFNNPYTRGFFIGTFASDRCPKKVTPNTCFVSNTDPHTLPGRHWIAIYVKRDGNMYYFDPYGIPPISVYHRRFLSKSTDAHGTYNRKQVQGLYSRTCGAHCVNFLIEACRTQDPNHTMKSHLMEPTYFLDALIEQKMKRWM